jgi:NarL family two-component system response regulator LiaR
MTKVLIVEDHQLVSQGMVTMLSIDDNIEVVGAVTSGELAIETVRNQEVNVVLMDVNLGQGISGIQAARKIKEIAPQTKVLMLTMYTDAQMVSDATLAGADGYLSKGASRETVVSSIADVMAGRKVLDPAIRERLYGKEKGRP